ncbi:XisI protein [Capilliphycus salinus ALCB114379]|uniref:XisI protein n=1 Tax=Capilliphycus salinus TaxID=2768948 RepID=UPI0039A51128
MDKVEQYSQIIRQLLTAYVAVPIANGEIESYTVFDTQQHHYQVMNVGWDGYRRVYGCVLHLDIIKNKVWVQQNMTEMRVAYELVDRGIPKEDIVLGFQFPELREYTDFAVV